MMPELTIVQMTLFELCHLTLDQPKLRIYEAFLLPAVLSKFGKIVFMSVSEIRQELHKAIDEIENKELLMAMLTILAQSRFQPDDYPFTDEQLNILREREEKYEKGESQMLTLEEFKRKMNKKYGL
jgi:hypothetical protein